MLKRAFVLLISVICFISGTRWEEGPYFEGDIRLPLPPYTRNGIVFDDFLWPGGKVYYEIDDVTIDADQRDTILRAMRDYYIVTDGCIEFIERTTEENYIIMAQDPGDEDCWSFVGKKPWGESQRINYPDWCLDQYGSVQHEMFHALGLFHEQSRTDRDDYVIIHYENVQKDAVLNFIKLPSFLVTDLGEPYDYLSVMHYSQTHFTINGNITIETVDPAYQDVIGQRIFLSDGDIVKLMKLYNCTAW